MKEKPLKKKQIKKKKGFYITTCGCWNCDSVYDIYVKYGEMTTKFIMDKKMTCKKCKCETLKMYKEYKIDNKIMKDIILHDKLEHMGEEVKKEPDSTLQPYK